MGTRSDRWFWKLARAVLSLRYRVTTTGVDLRDLQGPVVVLPNHPAYVDPALVLAHVGAALPVPLRPLVFSGIYRMAVLRPLMKLVAAFEVPDLQGHSRAAAARTQDLIDAVVAGVARGENFLIYPSGRLQRGVGEVVGSARLTHELLVRQPEVQVVLLRTRGVWGSAFSCATTGEPPDLVGALARSAGWAVASLFCFMPRRPVTMHAELVPRDRLPLSSREACNDFLERWYAADGGEPPRFVRYHRFLGPAAGRFDFGRAAPTVDPEALRPETIAGVNEMLAAHLQRDLDATELAAETRLDAIGLDSLERMELALEIERRFGFRSDTVAESLGQLWALADGRLGAGTDRPTPTPQGWFAPVRQRPRELLAGTVAEAFVRRALEQASEPLVADAVSGVLTGRRLLVAATLLARRFAAWPEPHVGVLLPASVAADVVFFALHLAGKVPVMMNWTTGPATLAHAARVTDTRRVVTSRRLVDRLGIDVPAAEEVFLEDLKRTIRSSEALALLAAIRLAPGRILAGLPRQDPHDPAVFLFTSGSETAPKTVPLTHDNLFTNVADALEVLAPDAGDSLLGFLPPFHSFGLTGNVLLPHLAGIRSVRHADPTDAPGLVQLIRAYRPTMLFSTPTFLGYILAACRGEELASLRKIITGAERCPEATFAACRERAPQAVILEGYGITECSPVVAANRLDQTRPGSIGRPVRHVETLVVDPDTHEPVPVGEPGMLLVRGRSIFRGYHGHDGPSPFVTAAGREWYRTGDLVSADDGGWLTFRGRLTRFLKAGGEMLSLPALEDPFQRLYPPDDAGPRVAVEGVETAAGRHVVLFTTFDLPLREAAAVLRTAGFHGVMRLDEVRRIERIPVLGTGKTDYRTLRRLVVPAPAPV